MAELFYESAAGLVSALRTGRVTATAAVQACQARIVAVNPALNAVVQLRTEAALADATAADAAFSRGEPLGALHGLPFTVKDSLDVAGVIGAMGVAERVGVAAEGDATVVARLRAAGAIVLGKTNVPPWGGGIETDNPVYGRTNNPYDLGRTPGGSSGGEAAIIAAGGSPLGVGSDSGGSLRLPAHNCGVATIKPTAGRVPTTNAGRTADLSDPRTQVGLLARRVADLALVLPIIGGPEWRDAATVATPLLDPGSVAVERLRIAFYTNDGVSTATAGIRETVRQPAIAIAATGATVEEQRPPGPEQCWPITRVY